MSPEGLSKAGVCTHRSGRGSGRVSRRPCAPVCAAGPLGDVRPGRAAAGAPGSTPRPMGHRATPLRSPAGGDSDPAALWGPGHGVPEGDASSVRPEGGHGPTELGLYLTSLLPWASPINNGNSGDVETNLGHQRAGPGAAALYCSCRGAARGGATSPRWRSRSRSRERAYSTALVGHSQRGAWTARMKETIVEQSGGAGK